MSSKVFKIAFEETKENVAVEGTKGAVIGMILGGPLGAVIGHFWQEHLIKKEKEAKEIEDNINALQKDEAKPGVKQKLELLNFKQKKVKEEIQEVKSKVKNEEINNKKIEETKKKQKISKEELAESEQISEEIPTETPPEEEISEEEKATEVSIEELTEEIGRQEELADGLDALRTIATRVETPTPTDVALFRVAANMAVAGTDEEAQDFIPAIESNKPIDIKGFDKKIKDIKDKIATLKVELSALEAKKKIK